MLAVCSAPRDRSQEFPMNPSSLFPAVLYSRSSHLLRLLRGGKSDRRRSRSTHVHPTECQQLETRILPATLVNPTTLTYQDIDGDNVAVTFSNPILAAANVNSIFAFNTGNVNGNNNVPQQLRSIKLSKVAAASGTTITTVATRNPVKGGDGFAALGQIDATGRDLGAVTIDGDLGRIIAGDATTASPGVANMTVYSMGRYGTVTGAVDLNSTISGSLGSMIVRADIKGAFVKFVGGVNGRVDILTVGGSMIGSSAANSGRVHTDGNMGKVTIGGDVIGGGGTHSGAITSFSNIASVVIAGSLVGGSSTYAGTVLSDYLGGGFKAGEVGGHIGPVSIGRDVLGGSNTAAGTIISESGRLGNVTIGGSLLAGSANRSAHIHSNLEMGAVSIGGSVVGGIGNQSGQIESMSTLGNVTIGGSLKGGGGENSGQVVSTKDMGALKLTGNVVGGGGILSGSVLCGTPQVAGKLTSVNIGGSVRGGTNAKTGMVFGSRIGPVVIIGGVIGGSGTQSGSLHSIDRVDSVTIGGTVRGGLGDRSGTIDFEGSFADVGAVKVVGDVIGGPGTSSGSISANNFVSVVISGSLIGGTRSETGQIFSRGQIGSVAIAGNIRGGSASGTANLFNTGKVTSALAIGTLTLGGSIIAGTDNTSGKFVRNGSIHAGRDIGRLTIKGSIIGNATHTVLITAVGKLNPPAGPDLAFGSIVVNGRVEHGLIQAGYNLSQYETTTFIGQYNADANIGSVAIGGDWIASSLVAGADAGPDGVFGTKDDAKFSVNNVELAIDRVNAFSGIASVTIGGQVVGTELGGDHFGIVAESVGVLSIGANVIPLLAGMHNDNILLTPLIDGFFGDLRLREI